MCVQTILSLASLNSAIEDDVRDGLRKTSKRCVYKNLGSGFEREMVQEDTGIGRALWCGTPVPRMDAPTRASVRAVS